jgi:hypothetical protein
MGGRGRCQSLHAGVVDSVEGDVQCGNRSLVNRQLIAAGGGCIEPAWARGNGCSGVCAVGPWPWPPHFPGSLGFVEGATRIAGDLKLVGFGGRPAAN